MEGEKKKAENCVEYELKIMSSAPRTLLFVCLFVLFMLTSWYLLSYLFSLKSRQFLFFAG